MFATADPFEAMKVLVGAGIVMWLLAMMIPIASLTLLIWALVRCVKEQPERDRLMWVLIIILVPLIGPILYFTVGRPSGGAVKPAFTPPPPASRPASRMPNSDPPTDLTVLHDEKQRAASINAALAAMSRRR